MSSLLTLLLTKNMYYYLGLALLGILGFILGKKFAKIRASKKASITNFSSLPPPELQDLRKKATEALDERTEERKNQILEFLKRETEHQQALKNCSIENRPVGITREEVENLLKVSDKTALKYLNELESENKIVQSSPAGPTVRYILK